MTVMGAHKSTQNGIHSKNGIVYSIICNSNPFNRIQSNGNLLYSSHQSISARLEHSNKSMILTGLAQNPIRLYTGPGSIISPCKDGYQLFGLVYVISAKMLSADTETKKIFLWRFELSTQNASQEQLKALETLFRENQLEVTKHSLSKQLLITQ
jgi:hypothetical protein